MYRIVGAYSPEGLENIVNEMYKINSEYNKLLGSPFEFKGCLYQAMAKESAMAPIIVNFPLGAKEETQALADMIVTGVMDA